MIISVIMNSLLLGIGLAMDAFSVSLANGLNYKNMRVRKQFLIAGVFGTLQAVMSMVGWFIVMEAVSLFSIFAMGIPWIAAGVLVLVGIKMILEGIRGDETDKLEKLSLGAVIIQGVATSLDALSVGFTIASYSFIVALVCSLIIAVITFFICFAGVSIGRRCGTKLAGKSEIFGGVILIGIAIEILIKGLIG